jgi:purine-binding chemotaxis protein CheW
LPSDTQRVLLVFQLSGETTAFPLEAVEKIAPMAQLSRPPGMPHSLEGILNLGGIPTPVLRLDKLLDLEPHDPGLYSALIVLKGNADGPLAVLVDRVLEILSVPESDLVPVAANDSFNACVGATARLRGESIHLLSPERILLRKERQRLSEFKAAVEWRLEQWEPEQA